MKQSKKARHWDNVSAKILIARAKALIETLGTPYERVVDKICIWSYLEQARKFLNHAYPSFRPIL